MSVFFFPRLLPTGPANSNSSGSNHNASPSPAGDNNSGGQARMSHSPMAAQGMRREVVGHAHTDTHTHTCYTRPRFPGICTRSRAPPSRRRSDVLGSRPLAAYCKRMSLFGGGIALPETPPTPNPRSDGADKGNSPALKEISFELFGRGQCSGAVVPKVASVREK